MIFSKISYCTTAIAARNFYNHLAGFTTKIDDYTLAFHGTDNGKLEFPE